MKVIVSVTTTKARLRLFFYTLQSLKRQSYDNFIIFINLSKDPYLFDEGIDVVPDWMTSENVRINFVKNLGSFRKLIPVIEQIGEDDILVTADDDVLYFEDWLKNIVKNALLHPDTIVCCSARCIRKNFMGRFQNYSNWMIMPVRTMDMNLLPLGGSGAAYRKKLLDVEFLKDNARREYAPTADDIWFRLASIRKNTMVYVDPEMDEGNGYIRHSMGLEHINLHKPHRRRRLYERVLAVLIIKFANYFGVPLSKNDIAWKESLKYSNKKPLGAPSRWPVS